MVLVDPDVIFCENLIVEIVRLSSINETFVLVREVSSGIRGNNKK